MEELRTAAGVETDSLEDVRSSTTDADFLMLLNALERLILLNLQNPDPGTTDEEDLGPQKPVGMEGGGGILGIMTNVFTSDSPPSAVDEQLTVHPRPIFYFRKGAHLLHRRVLLDIVLSMMVYAFCSASGRRLTGLNPELGRRETSRSR